jgi:SAM-dependent methyltransferase
VEELRSVFDSVARDYDDARPGYPPALFDDLVELAQLEPGARLLEIGCGTGKATRPLVERGFEVTCVELGPRLADETRRALPVDVHVAPFEEWDADGARFDLVYAATAWHWLDPELRYRKAHDLLHPGGHLAHWSAGHGFPEDFDPFFTEIQAVYDELGESHPGEWPPAPPERVADARAEIERTGLFDDVQVRRHLWATRYTAAQYVALLDTFSGHLAMAPEKRAHLYAEVRSRIGSGTVLRHWLAILHVARRP